MVFENVEVLEQQYLMYYRTYTKLGMKPNTVAVFS